MPSTAAAYVTSDRDLERWHDRVWKEGISDPNLLLLLFTIEYHVDKTSFVVSSTIPDLATRAALPIGMVEDLWPDLLASPFIERIGSGEWTLRLVIPD
jgi:hypothetical protein